MFLKYGTLASTYLRRGLSTRKTLVLSRHSNIYSFRPAIIRTYCVAKSLSDVKVKINDRALSNEISEILDSPDKIQRDHKHYRFAIFTVYDVILT